MKHIKLIILIVVIFNAVIFSCNDKQDNFSELVKIALRDAGNNLLLSQQDSTSLILPVKEVYTNKFRLAFNNSLLIEPDTLVTIISESLLNSKLPVSYITEVKQCKDNEVAYSYKVSPISESTIIPCLDRFLPRECYYIEISFTQLDRSNSRYMALLGLMVAILILLLGFLWIKKQNRISINEEKLNYKPIGIFKFYPEQNKLIKEAEEIALSKKECELLALFAERPNEIIKRDELTKKVWEDNGVFVGRSLDTYISKLRKKLKTDTSIKLTNVHGVGYKLEVL